MKTETVLISESGRIQYSSSEDELMACYNNLCKIYEIRVIDGFRVLWHKGHAMKVGTIETIPARG